VTPDSWSVLLLADAAAVAAATAAWTTQRRAYRALLRQKCEAFWRNKVDAERSSPRQLWQSVDTLLGRGRVPPNDSISAVKFHQFFEDKVTSVRATTADAPPPLFVPVTPGCELLEFDALTVDDIVAAVSKLPDKQCASDPIPTSLLHEE